ncbi:MAG: hypothetical protein ACOCUV_00705 [bacterium]
MSLGQKTKCDLSADVAKLDVKELEDILEQAFINTTHEICNMCNVYGRINTPENKEVSDIAFEFVCHESKMLISLAEQLGKIAEVYRTIHVYNLTDRKLVPVNKEKE